MDFKQAYDNIHRDSLWFAMQECGVPEKLIRMTRICLNDAKAAVMINGELTAEFEVKTGLRQGDLLSPTLFNIALEKAIRTVQSLPFGVVLGDNSCA